MRSGFATGDTHAQRNGHSFSRKSAPNGNGSGRKRSACRLLVYTAMRERARPAGPAPLIFIHFTLPNTPAATARINSHSCQACSDPHAQRRCARGSFRQPSANREILFARPSRSSSPRPFTRVRPTAHAVPRDRPLGCPPVFPNHPEKAAHTSSSGKSERSPSNAT